ncbi:PaaI family thioesterase [Gordonia aichiensis]|uniref:PaaI family thioesterase n=1 Tax=Gordonia aichiensis TaxID=36820 RepID=UPI003262D299
MADTVEFEAGGAVSMLRARATALGAERSEFRVETGHWLRDPEIGRVASALAVPLDDATGYIVANAAPTGRWPVSLSMKIDVLRPIPLDGTTIRVAGELAALTDVNALTHGVAYDDAGQVVATLTHRSHLIDATGPQDRSGFDPVPPDGRVTVREALEIDTIAPGELIMAPTPWSANIMGDVHGGVLVVGAELAAHSALGPGYTTVSIDATYLRPCDATAETGFHATVVHTGRTTAMARVEARLLSGRPCVVATAILRR